jgi:hypothetical protein
MQIRFTGCVPQNYIQLWYSFLSLATKIRSPNRPWKIICSDFGLSAQQGFQRSYLLAPLSELALPHVQIEGIVEAHNFGSQTFAIKGRLSLRICTEISSCPGLREYLSGWVDLLGKHPIPRSFACWCFGTWVVWSLVPFMSWLVTGFMIFSWSVWWTYPENLIFNIISCVNNKLKIDMQVWTCYIISMPSAGLVANNNWNQCITSTLGWRKFTINICSMLKPCSSSSK